jgi:uncharacterized membrane protein YqaE (UPF0057 family)
MPRNQQSCNLDVSDILLILLAFVAPPIPVLIRYGFFTNEFLLNVLLTILFGLPGTIHSIYLVYRSTECYQSRNRDVDYEQISDCPHEARDTSAALRDVSKNDGYHHIVNDTHEGVGSSSKVDSFLAEPPAYEESETSFHNNPTDNKVQR